MTDVYSHGTPTTSRDILAACRSREQRSEGFHQQELSRFFNGGTGKQVMNGVTTKLRVVAERRGEKAAVQAAAAVSLTPRTPAAEMTLRPPQPLRGDPPGSRAAGAPTGAMESRPRGTKLCPSAPTMQSLVDQVVFGRDMDNSGETVIDAEYLESYDGAAGLPSGVLEAKPHGPKAFPSAPAMQSIVDQVVFGRDMDFSGEDQYDEEFLQAFGGAAGLLSQDPEKARRKKAAREARLARLMEYQRSSGRVPSKLQPGFLDERTRLRAHMSHMNADPVQLHR
eukprot:TRINITY_DN34778_c0_g1_i2.p1 TRINITY_DN34778_c0_g1~~TRINITY_DN34778_c0_g1_i2.p1  ORF type:complete len:281 (+),score=67.89 TRINITY_DN34778_c0_g1_i2:77-919(+)